MYIYDTMDGFNIIVEGISNNLIKSRTDLPGSQSKISPIRVDKYGDEYFKREGKKVYISQLEQYFE